MEKLYASKENCQTAMVRLRTIYKFFDDLESGKNPLLSFDAIRSELESLEGFLEQAHKKLPHQKSLIRYAQRAKKIAEEISEVK